MKRTYMILAIFYMILVTAIPLFAQSISMDPSKASAVLAPAPELQPGDFLMQVVDVIKQLGGMSTMMKISAILMIIVASMKVSFLNQLVWSKLGAAKVFVAPVLALVAGLLGLGAGGVPITGPLVVAYLFAGGGAVFLHQVLDSLKELPGIGQLYISLIDFVSGLLKGPK